MKTMMIAALAVGGFLMASSAVANADVQAEGSYATLAACQADGAEGDFTMPAGTEAYGSFYCQQGDNGLYYLWFSN
jgi:hypothetical protein